jgi:hypothetical protein
VEAAQVPWRPLGALFVARGLITESELETALAEQAATGKRLGEILVDRGLVSGPDLTAALMDQLGTEISKEEGYGSGLWAEIKRRHKRARREDAEDGADDIAEGPPTEIALVPPAQETEPEVEPGPDRAPEPGAAVDELPVSAEPNVVDPELEQELQEIRAEYTAPAERKPADKPKLAPAVDASAREDEVARLRAELAESREELAHLQGLLADAMAALAALTDEAAGEPDAES